MPGATYSNPIRVTYSFPNQNFASSAITRKIKPPPGCVRGVIQDVTCSIVTTFTQTTTPGHVRIGDGTTDGKFADLNMGAAAGGTSYGSGDVPGTITSTTIDLDRDGGTDITLKTVAPTGGSPAGVADVYVIIDWS